MYQKSVILLCLLSLFQPAEAISSFELIHASRVGFGLLALFASGASGGACGHSLYAQIIPEHLAGSLGIAACSALLFAATYYPEYQGLEKCKKNLTDIGKLCLTSHYTGFIFGSLSLLLSKNPVVNMACGTIPTMIPLLRALLQR